MAAMGDSTAKRKKSSRVTENLPPTPKTFKEVKALSYSQLLRLCKDAEIKTSRIGRDALEVLLCDAVGVSTTGSNKLGREVKKPRLNDHALDENEVKEFEDLTPAKVLSLEGWTKSLKDLPDLDIGMVKKYLLKHDNTNFTKAELKHYKLCRAYEHIKAKHIHSVMFNPLITSPTFCIIKAQCLPSQSGENKKVKWLHVILDKLTGEPYGAFCSCTVGRGQACTHVGALLFLLCELVAFGATTLPEEKSCTDVLCPWSDPKGSNVEPTLAENVSIGGSECGPSIKNYASQVAPALSSEENYDRVLKLLFDIRNANEKSAMPAIVNIVDLDNFRPHQIPPSPLVHSSLPDRCLDFDIPPCMEISVQSYPMPVYQVPCSLADRTTDIDTKTRHFVNQLLLTDEEIARVEVLTREQTKTNEWYEQRKGCVTGSKAYKVLSYMEHGKSNPILIIKDIMGYSTNQSLSDKIPSLAWGLKHESTALSAYVNDLKNTHIDVVLERPGLMVHPDCIYLRASPDAIISCKCHGKKIVEVKCPFKHRSDNIDDIITKKGLEYIEIVDGKRCVKKRQSRGYYEQINMQQAITKHKKAEMLIWTKKGYVIIDIPFDQFYWENVLFQALSKFFMSYVVPEIITGQIKKEL